MRRQTGGNRGGERGKQRGEAYICIEREKMIKEIER